MHMFVTLLALACNACGMNLRPQPVAQLTNLGGHWQLAVAEREALMTQLRTQMDQARTNQMRREQKRQHGRPAENIILGVDGAPPSDDQQQPRGAINNWQAREQRELQTALVNAVAPSLLLQIQQTPTRIEMLRDNSARRVFTGGVSSVLVTSYATLQMESGWQGNEFVVHSKDAEQDMEIVERYQRDAQDRLSLRLELAIPGLKDQTFSLHYTLQAAAP
jgi:hypothetical protein